MKTIDKIRSDLRMLQALGRLGPAAVRNRPGTSNTVVDAFEKVIADKGDAVAIIDADDDGREVTYAELGRRANQIAHWALDLGIGRGSHVALLMPNRPEYLPTWLGIAKTGALTALINTNLTGDALRHSIRIAEADHLIVDRELLGAWEGVRDDDSPTEWHTGPGQSTGGDDFDAAIADRPTVNPDPSVRKGLTNKDPLFYIYTSGTTGFPKAARFSHAKFMIVAPGLNSLIGLKPADRMYVTLPLYHTAGGVMALGGPLLMGGSVVLARKFSASRFWDHCHAHEPTAFQYIGELCRYLLNSAPHPLERRHTLRVCLGNGLRPDVWPGFQERFAIPRIVEFYGATEGTASLINLDNKVGSIGRLPGPAAKVMGLHLVRYDIENDEIVRDANGRCIDVEGGEPGEAISRISEVVPFDGYSDPEATEKKILRNAFKEGDTYFRSGDLLSRDADGYYYFVDRIGDTFRWKAENVSTAEVAHVLGTADGVLEANVYGVTVPGADGRAGMATLVVDDDFELDALHRHAEANLASYARPLFLRLRFKGQGEVEITGTFKHRKVDLVEQGFDPGAISDPLYVLHPAEKRYVELDAELHAKVLDGELRL